MILPFDGLAPVIPDESYISPTADVIGDVNLGERVSVWFHAVLRGDLAPISIGDGTNIQDGCILHVDRGQGVSVGHDVTVGHNAVLHACTVGDRTLIGMGAIVLSGAHIGSECIIGAGALIPQHKEIPDGTLVLGSPGKVVRVLTAEERAGFSTRAAHYWEYACRYR
jgi:carbonic anhydrase/acetyltransferase-like protein (isoleucine patch superfamily)